MCALDLPSAPPEPASDWGDWRLGDLFSVVQRLSQVLDGTLRVHRLAVWPPVDGDAGPRVDVVVEDHPSLAAFLGGVLGSEPDAQMCVSLGRIEIEIDRVRVHVLLVEQSAGGVGDG